MTITATPDRILREDRSGNRLIVAGDRGAVECRTVSSGLPTLVDYHSPRPQFPGDEAHQCDVIAGACYPEAGLRMAALQSAWLSSGSDDEVIWAELEQRYAAWELEG